MGAGFGAYGKIPGLGDFFRIDVPSGFVPVWDTWLQQNILHARQTLGEAWDALYMSAPIWRFTLAAGLAGERKVLGVLMPSVDRVGRQYPLTLLAPLDGASTAIADHFSASTDFAALEDLALDMLEDGQTRERLQERLADLSPPDPAAISPVCSYFGSMVTPDGDSAAIAADLADQRFHQPSVWSCQIDDRPKTLICEKLPAEPAALGLFDLNAPIWTEATPL